MSGREGRFAAALILLTVASVSVVLTTLVLYRSLLSNPVQVVRPEEIVVFTSRLSGDEYRQLTLRTRGLRDIGAYMPRRVRAEAQGTTGAAQALLVTPNYFELLGVRPALGRPFSSRDSEGGAAVVVVSERFWKSHFANRNGIESDWIRIQDERFEIVGVVPNEFRGITLDSAPELFVPFWTTRNAESFLPNPLLRRVPAGGWLVCFGRLTKGKDLRTAGTETLEILLSLEGGRWQPSAKQKPLLESLADAALLAEIREPIKRTMTILGVLAGLMFAVAAANIGILCGLHVLARRPEIGLREIIGATPARIGLEFAVEYGRLGLVGGVLALLPALLFLSGLERMRLARFVTLTPRLGLDASTTLIAVALGTFLPVVLSALWMLSFRSDDLAQQVKESGASGLHGRTRRPLRLALVLQAALAVTLLGPALLLLGSLEKIRSTPLGFDRRQVLWARLDLDLSGLDKQATLPYLERVRASLAELPGVEAVGLSTTVPLGWVRYLWSVEYSDRADQAGRITDIATSFVDSHYFHALGIPLISGTSFSADSAKTECLLNRAAALQLGGPAAAVGHALKVSNHGSLLVVGVVENSRYFAPDEQPAPHLYLPIALDASPFGAVIVRTSGPADALLSTIRQAIGGIRPGAPISELLTMEHHVELYLSRTRLIAASAALFALNSVLLAGLATYLTVRHGVNTRRREVAIRLALGGEPRDVRRWIVRETLPWGGLAVALGMLGALAASRLMRSEIYGVPPADAFIVVTAAGFVALAMLPGVLVPAFMASRSDPSMILRRP